MKAFVSTLFQVMCFPHNGHKVSIEQLSFTGLHMMVNQQYSLNFSYIPVSSTPPQVNYVATCPMHSTRNEKEYLPSSDLDLVADMVLT
jgi:hypothetical protein